MSEIANKFTVITLKMPTYEEIMKKCLRKYK